MTKQEALKIVNVNGYGYPEDDVIRAHEIIKREMGFRIERPPMQKQIHGTSLFGEALCPECGTTVYATEGACSKCGQLLDWSDYDDYVIDTDSEMSDEQALSW